MKIWKIYCTYTSLNCKYNRKAPQTSVFKYGNHNHTIINHINCKSLLKEHTLKTLFQKNLRTEMCTRIENCRKVSIFDKIFFFFNNSHFYRCTSLNTTEILPSLKVFFTLVLFNYSQNF